MKKNTTVTNYCHLFFKWIYIDFPNSNSEVPYILKKGKGSSYKLS